VRLLVERGALVDMKGSGVPPSAWRGRRGNPPSSSTCNSMARAVNEETPKTAQDDWSGLNHARVPWRRTTSPTINSVGA